MPGGPGVCDVVCLRIPGGRLAHMVEELRPTHVHQDVGAFPT